MIGYLKNLQKIKNIKYFFFLDLKGYEKMSNFLKSPVGIFLLGFIFYSGS